MDMSALTDKDFDVSGVVAYTVLNEEGEVALTSGVEAEGLETVAPYLTHMANLIGEPFGFDEVEEAQIIGKNMTAVCVLQTDGLIAMLCESKAKIASIVKKVTHPASF